MLLLGGPGRGGGGTPAGRGAEGGPGRPHEEKRDQCENKWLRPEQLTASPWSRPSHRNRSRPGETKEPNGYTMDFSLIFLQIPRNS